MIKNMTSQNDNLKKMILTTSIVMLIGPVMVGVGFISGAQILDLDNSNSPFQETMLGMGSYITVLGWAMALLISLVQGVLSLRSDKRFFYLFLIILSIPLILYLLLQLL